MIFTVNRRNRIADLVASKLMVAITIVVSLLVVIVGVVSASLGDWIEQLRRAVGLKEDVALYAAILALAGVAFIVMAWTRRREAVDPSAS